MDSLLISFILKYIVKPQHSGNLSKIKLQVTCEDISDVWKQISLKDNEEVNDVVLNKQERDYHMNEANDDTTEYGINQLVSIEKNCQIFSSSF